MPIIRKLYRVGGSNALTVPDEVRKHLNVNRGDYLVWYIGKANRVMVEKLGPKKYPGFFLPGSGWVTRGKEK